MVKLRLCAGSQQLHPRAAEGYLGDAHGGAEKSMESMGADPLTAAEEETCFIERFVLYESVDKADCPGTTMPSQAKPED